MLYITAVGFCFLSGVDFRQTDFPVTGDNICWRSRDLITIIVAIQYSGCYLSTYVFLSLRLNFVMIYTFYVRFSKGGLGSDAAYSLFYNYIHTYVPPSEYPYKTFLPACMYVFYLYVWMHVEECAFLFNSFP